VVLLDVLRNGLGRDGLHTFFYMKGGALAPQIRDALKAAGLQREHQLFVDAMVERGSGRVINVASIVSFFPTPSFATYGASKAFVLSFSEALSQELRGTGVTVTAVCPGYTKTDMINDAVDSTKLETMNTMLPNAFQMDALTVAREGYKKCMQGRAVHINGLHNRIATEWVRLQPKWLVRNAGGLMSRVLK